MGAAGEGMFLAERLRDDTRDDDHLSGFHDIYFPWLLAFFFFGRQ